VLGDENEAAMDEHDEHDDDVTSEVEEEAAEEH